MRKRGKAAFERALESAMPLSEYLMTTLAAQHPPTTAEGRAALVAAARLLLAEINAPILAALLRRQVAELSGLSAGELSPLLASDPSGGPSARRARRRPDPAPGRAVPAVLARELIQAILLKPDLVRSMDLPRPADGTPEGTRLRRSSTRARRRLVPTPPRR